MARSITSIADRTVRSPSDPAKPIQAMPALLRVERKGERVWHSQEYPGPQRDRLGKSQSEVQFVIGSGQRGHSYLTVQEGFLFQTPISWYEQKKLWDLSPGFKSATLRPVASECLFCHAGGARPVPQTLNRYEEGVFTSRGISCERCHGPAERHVQYQEQGKHKKGQPDYTIVNPRRLERPLREDVCHQCHLAGETRVLRRGRGVFDYRPGLPLFEFWSIHVASPDVHSVQKAVGHVEQFTASKCFQESKGKMGCTTCHDPHERLAHKRRVTHYRQTCLQCHETFHPCKVKRVVRLKRNKNDSCIDCHMAHLNDTDIAHTAMTDHTIPLTPRILEKPETDGQTFILPREPLLDFHNERRGEDQESDRDLALSLATAALEKPETFGRALSQAVELGKKAQAKRPDDIRLLMVCGQALLRLEKYELARDSFQKVLEVEPRNTTAMGNTGVASYGLDEYDTALSYLDKALASEPWRGELYLFSALSRIGKKEHEKSVLVCKKWLEHDPGSAAAWIILEYSHQKLGKRDEAARDRGNAEALMTEQAEVFRQWFTKNFR
jgi:Tfp pilus assembly protein PilF